MLRFLLAAVFLGVLPASAMTPAPLGAGQSVEGEQAYDPDLNRVKELADKLEDDVAEETKLARRILDSKLARLITSAETKRGGLIDIKAWIKTNPMAAARVGVGLQKDDESGKTTNEDLMAYQQSSEMKLNPASNKGIFGRLRKKSQDSTLMNMDEDMSAEEKQEIIRSMFEGQGGASGRVLTQKDDGGDKGTVGGEAGFADSGFYDRLSQGNLTGYSPEIQAIQSALNARRIPGAPHLIETGKLDFPTLSYPAYGMDFDIKNLNKRLTLHKNFELAKLLGLEKKYSAKELMNPDLTAELEAQLKTFKKFSPRLKARLGYLDRAKQTLKDFIKTAQASRNPKNITATLLRSLGLKQKEAARWITLASLEEDLMRLEAEEGFMTPDLIKAIEALPLEKGAIDAYIRRGKAIADNMDTMKANDIKAQELLLTKDWLRNLGEVDGLVGENSRRRRNLSRNIQNFVRTPFRLHQNTEDKTQWRKTADIYIKRFLPTIAYSRRLKSMDTRFAAYEDVFISIAQGDLDGAHRKLASFQP